MRTFLALIVSALLPTAATAEELTSADIVEMQLSDVGAAILATVRLETAEGKRCIQPELADVAEVNQLEEFANKLKESYLRRELVQLLAEAGRNHNEGTINNSEWWSFKRFGYEILRKPVTKEDWQGCDVVFRPWWHPVISGDHAITRMTVAEKSKGIWATTEMFLRRSRPGWEVLYKAPGYVIVT